MRDGRIIVDVRRGPVHEEHHFPASPLPIQASETDYGKSSIPRLAPSHPPASQKEMYVHQTKWDDRGKKN
jgi:hypothetical protein